MYVRSYITFISIRIINSITNARYSYSTQFTCAALSLVALSICCGFIFYQIAVFGPLFQISLQNDPLLWMIFALVQSSSNFSEPLGSSKDWVIPNHGCKVIQKQRQ